MKYLLVLFILMTGSAALADIYKCVDADGTITYSDTGCPEGARQVDKRPEIAPAETKKLKPREPFTDRLNRLWTVDRYRTLTSPRMVMGVYGLMSLFCFIATYRDKRKSIKGQWRTPEKTLHLLELLGGWPGGLIAQQVFRHKTRKLSYQLTFWCIVGLHGLVWTDVMLQHKLYRALLDFTRHLL